MKDTVTKKCTIIFGVLFLISLMLLPFVVHDAGAEQGKEPCLEPYIATIVPSAGKPGEQVRIRGRRFGRNQGEVVFSPDIKAEIVTWKNSRIWVIVPSSAKSGPVTVSVPCGAVSNEKDFTVKK
jgi:hypothetical protein